MDSIAAALRSARLSTLEVRFARAIFSYLLITKLEIVGMATNTPSMHSELISYIRTNNQIFNIDLRFLWVFSLISNAKGVVERGRGG
jgi:hypothetical protein